LEIAEVATSAESSASATTTGATTESKITWAATASAAASARCLRQRLLELLIFHVLAHLVEVDSSKWIGGAALAADSDGFVREVGVVRKRRELRVGAGGCPSCLNEARRRAQEAEVLRAASGELPQSLCSLSGRIGAFLLRGARGERQDEVGLLIVRGGVEQGFFGGRGESGEICFQ